MTPTIAVIEPAAAAPAAPAQPSPRARLDLQFDLIDQNAVDYAEHRSARLVQGITEQARDALQQIVVRGFREGQPPAEMARAIRNIVGLDTRRAIALDNYRMAQAKRLRDQHPRWSNDQIAQKTEERATRYSSQLLRDRAMTIARTETINASSAGQRELWRQARSSGLLNFDDSLPTLYQTPNGPLAGPTAHPRCRCSESVRVVDGIARRFWVITEGDDRTCEICFAIPGMNLDGVSLGTADVEMQEAA